MPTNRKSRFIPIAALALLLAAGGCAWRSCGGAAGSGGARAPASSDASASGVTAPPAVAGASAAASAPAVPAVAFTAGNPKGGAAVPADARPVDTSRPTRVVGSGTPASCTSDALVKAVAAGGIITFSCGPAPVTITMTATAKVRNVNRSTVVLDGGGRVTLSGAGKRRILYLNTCDKTLGPAVGSCINQEFPQLTVQNLGFVDGNSTGTDSAGHGGGGAIFVWGGRFKVINSRFLRNRCDTTGPDLGGAAIRGFYQHRDQPIYIVNSTFGGAPGQGGSCANGGALSGLHASYTVLNSVITHNSAVGKGANPARAGTPGGGSGGGIYMDGNAIQLRLAGTIVEDNKANEGGGAVFFVSNDRTGTVTIDGCTLRRNRSLGFQNFPGMFFLGFGKPDVKNSVLR